MSVYFNEVPLRLRDLEPEDHRRFIAGWTLARGDHVVDHQSGRAYWSPSSAHAQRAADQFNRKYPWGAP